MHNDFFFDFNSILIAFFYMWFPWPLIILGLQFKRVEYFFVIYNWNSSYKSIPCSISGMKMKIKRKIAKKKTIVIDIDNRYVIFFTDGVSCSWKFLLCISNFFTWNGRLEYNGSWKSVLRDNYLFAW